jgi:hypothetical protein
MLGGYAIGDDHGGHISFTPYCNAHRLLGSHPSHEKNSLVKLELSHISSTTSCVASRNKELREMFWNRHAGIVDPKIAVHATGSSHNSARFPPHFARSRRQIDV